MSKFYQLSGSLRYFSVNYWQSYFIPYDQAWDNWVKQHLDGVRPVYVPVELSRTNSMVWVDDKLVWVANDPGVFGICVSWDTYEFAFISGRISRRTERQLRRAVQHLENDLDLFDTMLALEGDGDGHPDVLDL